MIYNRNDFKISFDGEPQFFVNEKKGTVTCKTIGYVVGPDSWTAPTINGFEVVEVATAKCSPNDTFDVNRGKRIAMAKAENKAYLTVARKLNVEAKNFQTILNAVNEFTDKAYRCCAHNEEYIESLSYPAHPKYQAEVLPPKRGTEK